MDKSKDVGDTAGGGCVCSCCRLENVTHTGVGSPALGCRYVAPRPMLARVGWRVERKVGAGVANPSRCYNEAREVDMHPTPTVIRGGVRRTPLQSFCFPSDGCVFATFA